MQSYFSTTFFSFADDGSWKISDMHWVYWAVTVPFTILVILFYAIFSYGPVQNLAQLPRLMHKRDT